MKEGEVEISPNLVLKLQSVALLAAVLLVGSNAFVLSPILSDVVDGLKTDPYRVTWAISAFGVSTAVSALTLAGLVDRMAVGRVLGGAALLLALAQVLSGLSNGWLWLCLSQALAGVSVGVLLPGSYATAAATAPAGREAARLGLVLTGWALSLVLAVPLAALITEWFGWRWVYGVLAVLSLLIGFALFATLSDVRASAPVRTPVWRAFNLPGVSLILIVVFMFMSAFYGCFAYFGVGIRNAFDLSAKGAGLFVLAYGLGFGMAGAILSLVAPKVTRGYLFKVLIAVAISYSSWRLALSTPVSAFLATMIWGGFNQLSLNGLIVSLNRQASSARGAVMGLNTAVTYSAVFVGPIAMGPVFAGFGFTGVAGLAAAFVLLGAAAGWRAI